MSVRTFFFPMSVKVALLCLHNELCLPSLWPNEVTVVFPNDREAKTEVLSPIVGYID